MKLSQLYEAISKIPPHIRAQADVGIVLNDHQAVIAGEAWLDAEDQDQFILGPSGSFDIVTASVRSRRPSN